MGIQVHIFGKDELVSKYRRIAAELPGIITSAMQIQMTRLADYVRSNELSGQVLNRRSGTLSRSIYGTASASGGHVIGTVGSRGVPYAVIWEETGAAAHDIVPVSAKALHFTVGGDGVFAMRAHIPQQDPRPFLAPALNERRDVIVQALRDAAMVAMRAT